VEVIDLTSRVPLDETVQLPGVAVVGEVTEQVGVDVGSRLSVWKLHFATGVIVRPPEAGTALVVVILKVQLVVAPVTLEVGVILQVEVPVVIVAVLLALIDVVAAIVAVKEPVVEEWEGFVRPNILTVK